MDGESMLSCIFAEPIVEIQIVNGAYVACVRVDDEDGDGFELKPLVYTDLDNLLAQLKVCILKIQGNWRREGVGELPQETKPAKARKPKD